MSDVPALRRGLAVLRLLAGRAGPVTAASIARDLDLPRSTTYHLLAELTDAGFVTHLPEERRYGLGVAAFELGSAYLRHDPLERLARPVLRRLIDRTGTTAHLGVLHGREALYLLREQPPHSSTVVTDVGVRLPAHLPASGRAMLAHLPAAQVRALFPSRAAFVDRTGRGPAHLPALRALLAADRRRGWAVEDGYVTPGFASVAVPVFDHGGRAVAAISTTFRHECGSAGGAPNGGAPNGGASGRGDTDRGASGRSTADRSPADRNAADRSTADRGGPAAGGPAAGGAVGGGPADGGPVGGPECGLTWPELAGETSVAAAELTHRINGSAPARLPSA